MSSHNPRPISSPINSPQLTTGEIVPGSRGNNVAVLQGMAGSSVGLMVIFVGLRLYSRAYLRSSLGSDDYLMVAAAVLGVAATVLTYIIPSYGVGYHIEDVDFNGIVHMAKITLSYQFITSAAMTFTKLSLCLTYRRLFRDKVNRVFCSLAEAFLLCWLISKLILLSVQCVPLSRLWDSTQKENCINFYAAHAATSATNSFSDFVVYLWPAREIWRVRIPVRQKLGLISIFGIGAVVSVCGIFRIHYTNIVFKSTDPFYITAQVWATTCLEVNIGVVCACAHGVRPAISKILSFVRRESVTELCEGTSGNSRGNNPSRNIVRGSSKPVFKTSISARRSLDDFELVKYAAPPGHPDSEKGISCTTNPLPGEIAHEHNPGGHSTAWVTSGERRSGETGDDSAPPYGIALTQQVVVDSAPMQKSEPPQRYHPARKQSGGICGGGVAGHRHGGSADGSEESVARIF